MSQLEDLSKDKFTALDRILNHQNIMKAVVNDKLNFLDSDDIENPEDYIFDRIFPHRFIPKTSEKQKTYITLSFGDYRSVKGGAFKSGKITFSVFTHQDLFRTDYGVLRTDYIISEIEQLMNSKRGIGIGKTEFFKMDELSLNSEYHGSYIAYKIFEFN
ncbi:MAG: hypothetical protein ACQEXX_01900 [Bacillota bacterium]